jgi:ribonuclease Y
MISAIFFTISFIVGVALGYVLRIQIAKKTLSTAEAKASKLLKKAKEEAEKIVKEAKEEISKRERFLFKRKKEVEEKALNLEKREKELSEKLKKIREKENEIEEKNKEIIQKLEKIAGLKKEEARKQIISEIEKEAQREIKERLEKLEKEGEEKFQKRAREILTFAIQRLALPTTQEITTTTLFLPTEEIKGKIIGKEGRNIRTLEKLTGVEIILDEETPQVLTISGFDPVRRQIAKLALEKLIKDGRIQPAKIEEKVKEAEKEIKKQMKEAGEAACLELGVLGLDPKLVQLLGRLKFRTSFGQNVLLHSMEVALLAEALASEIGADSKMCKIAGLLHDIGKAIDQQVSGSHVQIGMKILEKFGVDKKIIDAMKSHHEEYPPESIEATIVQVADQISGARPGARKENIEEYLKKLEDLEKIALSFPAVEKAWALEAGREIRVFVKAEEVDDFGARKLAKKIARRIEEELKYPGMIKVNVIRELRITEYAK